MARNTSAGLFRSRMRDVSAGSGASSSTRRSSRAAQTAYVARHQGSARPFWRRGWPNTRSQLSANTGPSSSTTTRAPATRRPTYRRSALSRTICFSSSRGSERVMTQSRSSSGSERTPLSSNSARGRFQMLARITSCRASSRSARALLPAPAGPTSSTTRGRDVPFRLDSISLQLAPEDGLEIAQHRGERLPGVHDVGAAAGPVGVPHDLATLADVVRWLVRLATDGDLGVDTQYDENIGRQDLAVVPRLHRKEPPSEARLPERGGKGVEAGTGEIGRAACRGRGEISGGAGSFKKKKKKTQC